MKFRKEIIDDGEPADPTAWLIDSGFADFILLNTIYIKYMCMLAYTFMHGYKLFPTFSANASPSFKFISMLFQCTGGGILVPIFVNAIPVTLAQDSYPVAIVISYLLHQYLPILRDVMKLSPQFKTVCIIMYEATRASVVIKLTKAAASAIPPSDFDIAIFGPIFCGTIAGCGGAFLPLNKGLDPIKNAGLGQPMLSAFLGATFFHLFVSTSLSDGVVEAPKKAQVIVACFFIAYNLYTTFPPGTGQGTKKKTAVKASTPKKTR